MKATQDIRQGKGQFLHDLLRQARCGDAPCSTLVNYEQSDPVWMGIQLHENPWIDIGKHMAVNFARTSTFINKYLDAIDKNVEKYLPNDRVMRAMRALDQTEWKANVMEMKDSQSWVDDIKIWPSIFYHSTARGL